MTGDGSKLVLALVAFAAGVALRHLPRFPKGAAEALNAYVVWVALPALILAKLPQLVIEPEVVWLVVLPWAALAVSVVLIVAASRALSWSRTVEGALLMTVPLANTSFLGLPLVEAHIGVAALPQAIVWDQLGTFLALATYGAFIIATYRPRAGDATGAATRPSARSILAMVFMFPPLLALLAALPLMATTTPPMIQSVLDRLGESLVPVVMVAVGLQWRIRLARHVWAPLGVALAARLVIVPALVLVAVVALGLAPLARGTAVLEAGMGPMITAGVLAIEAEIEPELTAMVLGWGTLISFVTTAAWAALI